VQPEAPALARTRELEHFGAFGGRLAWDRARSLVIAHVQVTTGVPQELGHCQG
jgi:hypothetical protein